MTDCTSQSAHRRWLRPWPLPLLGVLLSVFLASIAYGQSVTVTYSAGAIPTNSDSYSASCNGAATPMIVNIPAGSTVTGVNVTYQMTAQGGAWTSEQRSRLFSPTTNTGESGPVTGGFYACGSAGSGVVAGTCGNNAGTLTYTRTNLSFANGVSATGQIVFYLQAWRTWPVSSGCNTTYNVIPNNTWSVTVNYIENIPCSGTPAPGNTLASSTSVCPGANVNFSLQNGTSGTGVTYQWQVSTTGSGGPWTNVGGNTNTYSAAVSQQSWYQAIVTCTEAGGGSATSNPVQVNMGNGCQCGAYPAIYASSTADEEISNVTVGSLNNSSTCATVAPGPGSLLNRYSNYTGSVAAPSFDQGQSVSFSLTQTSCGGAFGNGFQIHIDWNQDGDFLDAGEMVYNQPVAASGTHTKTGNFTVPVTATPGITRMRVVNVETTFPTATNYAQTAYTWGETEDYCVNVTVPPPCAGTPDPGNTTSTASDVCPGTNFTLATQNLVTGGGITYQWQSSPDGVTYTDIGGANNSFYTTNQSAATWYQVVVTCTEVGGGSATSTPIEVTMSEFYSCYCVPVSAGSACLTNVNFGGQINNTTSCASPYYTSYPPGAGTTGTYERGVSHTFSFTTNGSAIVSVWIDFDHSGTFDADEWTQPATNATSGTVSIPIPLDAELGITGMRVRTRGAGNQNGAADACLTFGGGEAEDYLITIDPEPPCIAPGGFTTDALSMTEATISWTDNGSVSYNWEVRTSGAPGDPAPFASGNTASNSFTVSGLSPNTSYSIYVQSDCGIDGLSAWSTAYVIFTGYCTSGATSTADEKIANVTFANINNSSTAVVGYEDFTALTANVELGQSYPVSVQISNPFATDQVTIWIDFDHDLTFEASEMVFQSTPIVTPGAPHIESGNILIPLDALLGTTRMRVQMVYTSGGDTPSPCGSYTFGQTEDYSVSICTPPVATASVVDDCLNDQFTIDVDGGSANYTVFYTVDGGAQQSAAYTGSILALGPFATTSTVDVIVSAGPDCDLDLGSFASNCPITVDCDATSALLMSHCYSNGDTREFTFVSSDPGNTLVFKFLQPSPIDAGDGVTFFDGPIGGTQIPLPPAGGDLSSLGTIVSTGNTLSFSIQADGSGSCQDGALSQDWDFQVRCAGCSEPAADPFVTTDCNTYSFNLQIDLWDFGFSDITGQPATSATIEYTVNGGTPVQVPAPVNDIYDLGNFAYDDVVNVVILHEDDGSCNLNMGNFTHNLPCPPINDQCADATVLTVNGPGGCPAGSITGDTQDADLSGAAPACALGATDDVWYTFNTGTDLSFNLTITPGTATTIGYELFSACGASMGICDATGAGINALNGLAQNTDYWIRVFTTGEGTFDICLEGLPFAACTNTTQYQSNPAPTNGFTVTIGCIFATEYTEITGAVTGEDYSASSNNPTDHLTVHFGTFDGPVIIAGTTPLNFQVPANGNFYVHVNTDANCGTNTTCRDLTIQGGTPPPPPPNDDCDMTTGGSVGANGSLIFTGNSAGATNTGPGEAAAGFTSGVAWESFTLTDCVTDLTISWCASEPPRTDAYINLFVGCPYTSFVGPVDWNFNCANGSVQINYGFMSPGTYWVAIMENVNANGPYEIEILPGDPCPPPPGCGDNFYDTGGLSANYGNNENYTLTVCPDNVGDVVTVNFTSFSTEASWDRLHIYDGPTTASPMFSSGNGAGFGASPYGAGGWWGTTIPGPFTASESNGGCLTFAFWSDASGVFAGWEATLTCAPPPPCPDPVSPIMTDITDVSGTISWNGGAGTYIIEYGQADLFFVPGTDGNPGVGGTIITTTTWPYEITGLDPNTTYRVFVRMDCTGEAAGYSDNTAQVVFTTDPTPPANDDCDDAIALTVNPDLLCGVVTPGTLVGATASADLNACFGTADDDVWFSFVATAETHSISLLNIANGTTDLYHSVYSGACGALVNVSCSDPNSSTATGLTIGNTYYLRVYSWTSTPGQTTTFDVCIGTFIAPSCGDNFYDTGGPALAYGNGENYVLTTCPDNIGDVVTVTFNTFSTEASWDRLHIYDGPNTSSPMFASPNGAGFGSSPYGAGGWWGTTIPGPFTATLANGGCLTFAFWSDGSGTFAGWDAAITCAPPPNDCQNENSFGSEPVPAPGNTATIAGIWAGEYGTFTAATAGQEYIVSSSVPTDYLTVRISTYDGTVEVVGTSPVTFVASASADIFVHVNTDSDCGTENVGRDITIEATVPACTNGAQFGSSPAPAPGLSATNTGVWAGEYTVFTAASAGQEYTASSTNPTDYLTVRTGTPGGAVVIAGTTPLVFTAPASENLYVHVNTNSACGTENISRDITLSATGVVVPPANDNCADAEILTVNAPGDCPANAVAGTNTGANTDGLVPGCDSGTSFPDVWYIFNAGIYNSVEVDFTNLTMGDVLITVHETSCAGAEIYCDIGGDDFSLDVTPGADYIVRVFSNTDWGAPGDFTICVSATEVVSVTSRVMLDGPYNTGTGLMNDNLRSSALIPNAHPYGGAPFNHAGTETIDAGVLDVTGNDAIVDWVLLELRDQTTPSTIVATRAALVQRDGDIVDMDGVSEVKFFGVPFGSYHLAVRHRNHLGAMTAGTYPLSQIPTDVDLTDPLEPTYGTNARRDRSGVMTLWGGNANGNTLVNYSGFNNDRQSILTLLGAATFLTPQAGYLTQDVTMNGLVNYSGFNNDRQYILTTLGAATFLTPRIQQLP